MHFSIVHAPQKRLRNATAWTEASRGETVDLNSPADPPAMIWWEASRSMPRGSLAVMFPQVNSSLSQQTHVGNTSRGSLWGSFLCTRAWVRMSKARCAACCSPSRTYQWVSRAVVVVAVGGGAVLLSRPAAFGGVSAGEFLHAGEHVAASALARGWNMDSIISTPTQTRREGRGGGDRNLLF